MITVSYHSTIACFVVKVKCNECESIFYTEYDLNIHMYHNHAKSTTIVVQEKLAIEQQINIELENTHTEKDNIIPEKNESMENTDANPHNFAPSPTAKDNSAEHSETIERVRTLELACEFCPYVTQKAMEFMIHLKTHNTNFNCKECAFTSSSQFAFEVHMQNDQTPQSQLHACTDCGMIFVDENDLKGHRKRQHDVTEVSNERTQVPDVILKCDKCQFTTKEEVVFRQHILTTHVPGFDCHECELVIKPKDLVAGCSVCDFYYHKKCTNLAKAQGGHWKPKDWRCHYCSSKISTNEETTTQAGEYVKDTAEIPSRDGNNHLKTTLNMRHRKSNLNLDKPELEFLQSQLDSCRGIIAQREAELKKMKESDTLKAKRIMQLDAQLEEARQLINKTAIKGTEESEPRPPPNTQTINPR